MTGGMETFFSITRLNVGKYRRHASRRSLRGEAWVPWLWIMARGGGRGTRTQLSPRMAAKATASEEKPAVGDCGEPFARAPGDGRRLILVAFTFALPFGLTFCAAVAARAVFDVCNSFCAVLGNDARLLVLMAAVTAVTLVISAKVAGRTGHVVFSVKYEEAAVIERGWFPARRLMTG